MASYKPIMEENHDIFDCQVCMEEMINKKPRLLPCGHTFCSECLEQIIKGGGITCPTCRSKVDTTKITDIPVNFNLAKMKQIELDLVRVNLNSGLCKICISKGNKMKAEVVCIDCDRNMCEGCSKYHAGLPAFSTHKVTTLDQDPKITCQVHGQTAKFFCTECAKALCVDCTFETEHSTHLNHIKDISAGLTESKHKMQTVLTEVQRISQEFPHCIEGTLKIKSEMIHRMQEMQKEAKQFCDDFLEHLPSEEQMASIQNDLIKSQKELFNLVHAPDHLYLNNLASVDNNSDASLVSASHCQKEFDQIAVFRRSNANIKTLIRSIFKRCKRQQTEAGNKPFLLLDLDCVKYDISLIADVDLTADIIFVTDHCHHVVKIFSMAGDLVTQFKMEESNGALTSIRAFPNELYVAQQFAITVVSLGYIIYAKQIYKPNVSVVADIAVMEPMQILIVDRDGGTLCSFNCFSQKTRVIDQGLHEPNSITFSHNIIAVVNFGNKTVNIYNSSFELLGVVRGDCKFSPMRALVLPSGMLLVSANNTHSICEYDQKGKHIKCVLDENDGISYPWMINYKDGKLLVTERDWNGQNKYAGVKLFLIE